MIYESGNLQTSRDRLIHMYCRSRQQQGLPVPTDLCSMLATRESLEAPTTSSTRFSLNGDSLVHGGPGSGRNPGGGGQGEGSNEAPAPIAGHQSVHASGPSRSENKPEVLAVLRESLGRGAAEQRPRTMDPLLGMPPPDVVYSEERVAFQHHGGPQCSDGDEDAEAVESTHWRPEAHGKDMPPHAGEDHGRGGSGEIDQGVARGRPSGTSSDLVDNPDHGGLHQRDDQGQRRGVDCSLRSGGRGGSLSEVTMRPLSQHMAKKVMLFVSLMTTATSNLLMGIQLDGRDGLWEISGAPHSWLSQAADQYGLQARPINYQTGYDLYKEETWNQLRRLRHLRQPRRVWFSLPCSKWCPWKAIDSADLPQRESPEAARRKEGRALRLAVNFVKETLEEDPDVQIYWEWPSNSAGWSQHAMLELQEWFGSGEFPWLSCRIDGCAYGLKDEQQGAFLRKRWTIKTTDELFHRRFRAKVCPGLHPHADLQSMEHTQAAYYPWRMVESITRAWRDEAAPVRHQQLLHLRHDLPALCDGDDLGPPLEHDELQFHEATMESDGQEDSPLQEAFLHEQVRVQVEHFAREARMRQQFDFTDCERILYALQQVLQQRLAKNPHSRGTITGTTSFNLGAYSHGSFTGVHNITYKNPELFQYLNSFLRHHLPQQQWSSIMITFNTRVLPHCDHHNLKGSQKHSYMLWRLFSRWTMAIWSTSRIRTNLSSICSWTWLFQRVRGTHKGTFRHLQSEPDACVRILDGISDQPVSLYNEIGTMAVRGGQTLLDCERASFEILTRTTTTQCSTRQFVLVRIPTS